MPPNIGREDGPDYKEWAEWISSAKFETWKIWGLHDMITLSTTDITPHFNIIFPLMGFWLVSLNAFIFP